jgi:hypothetical protein
MATYFIGIRFVNDDLADGVDAYIDVVEYERGLQTHTGLRTEIEGMGLLGEKAQMQMRLDVLQNQLRASQTVEVKTATQLEIAALNEQLSDLDLQLQREALRVQVEEAKRVVEVAKGDSPYWQDAIANKMGHGDASNQIDETGEHAERIHALLNVTRGHFLKADDNAVENAVMTVKAAQKYFPDITNESSVEYLNQAIAARLEGAQFDGNGNRLPTRLLQGIANEVFAYLEYEYLRPQMEAQARKQANRAATAAQIAANKKRYEGVGAAINAEKAQALQNRGAMSEAMMGIMLRNEANRQSAQRRILNR